MVVTLETLELTPQELESCREAVRRLAYCNWLDAGCPGGDPLDFWVPAEEEWIKHNYVPHRTLDGSRPEPAEEGLADRRCDCQQETSRKESRRHGRARAKAR